MELTLIIFNNRLSLFSSSVSLTFTKKEAFQTRIHLSMHTRVCVCVCVCVCDTVRKTRFGRAAQPFTGTEHFSTFSTAAFDDGVWPTDTISIFFKFVHRLSFKKSLHLQVKKLLTWWTDLDRADLSNWVPQKHSTCLDMRLYVCNVCTERKEQRLKFIVQRGKSNGWNL